MEEEKKEQPPKGDGAVPPSKGAPGIFTVIYLSVVAAINGLMIVTYEIPVHVALASSVVAQTLLMYYGNRRQ